MPFIRIFRPSEKIEMLLSVDHIWKIEVSYAVPCNDTLWRTTLEQGLTSEEAVRLYKVFVGSEVINLLGNPDSKVVKVIEEIYKNAICDDEPDEPQPNSSGA